jgi:two-component system, cell cycle response regulator DivK
MVKILVVEDSPDIAELLLRQLQRKGYDVAMADDGDKGSRMAKSEKPDLILMDMELPVVAGWEAIRRIKGDPETKSIPVIALTAHVTSGDRELGFESGADGFFHKPIDFPKLFEHIESLLKERRGPAGKG